MKGSKPLHQGEPINLEAWIFSMRMSSMNQQGTDRLQVVHKELFDYLKEKNISVDNYAILIFEDDVQTFENAFLNPLPTTAADVKYFMAVMAHCITIGSKKIPIFLGNHPAIKVARTNK